MKFNYGFTQNMYQRDLASEIVELIKGYPVLTIIGPHQSGKTTLVKALFPHKPYVSLEELDQKELAFADPRQFLNRFPDGAILDEIQRAPLLLSYIQSIVDSSEKKGIFILTGSHQFELHQAITQSLAGRTALVTLLPMSLQELKNAGFELSTEEYLIKGGYPRIYKDKLNPTKAYRNYFQTYVERDLRQIINIKDLFQFEQFVKICAGRIGQIIAFEEIGGQIGISSHTVKHWLSILEASFIIFRLQPYFENFGKRMIKAPKLYFTDVGLASSLLGIETENQMSRDPLKGHLFENLVILEMLKKRYNRGKDPSLYYYRDSHQNEVDVIFKKGNDLVPMEIKSSQTYHSDFLSKLSWFQDLAKERAPISYLIYAGEIQQTVRTTRLINYQETASIIELD